MVSGLPETVVLITSPSLVLDLAGFSIEIAHIVVVVVVVLNPLQPQMLVKAEVELVVEAAALKVAVQRIVAVAKVEAVLAVEVGM
jgi:hypothetical protein